MATAQVLHELAEGEQRWQQQQQLTARGLEEQQRQLREQNEAKLHRAMLRRKEVSVVCNVGPFPRACFG